MMLQRFRLLLLPLLALTFAACDSEAPEECPGAADCVDPSTTSIYVGNQGVFPAGSSGGNGTVTRHDVEPATTQQDAVPDLGGIVQALAFGPERDLLALLNFGDSFATGRGRIDVVDRQTNRRTAQVDVSTPRGIAFVGERAFVSNLYADTVTPLAAGTLAPGTPIPVGSNPEGVVAVGNRVYVANYGFGFSTTLSVIDAATNAVVQTVDAECDGPRALLADGDGEVWAFCTGKTVYDEEFNVIERTNGAAVVLDGVTGAVRARIALDQQLGSAAFGQDADYDDERREAYAVRADGAILRFDTRTNALAATLTPALPAGHLVGAVGFDDVNDWLLVGAVAPDFTSPGEVLVLDRAGAEVRRLPAGVIPSSFAVDTVAR